jgi:hypothetical protein
VAEGFAAAGGAATAADAFEELATAGLDGRVITRP